MAEAAEQRESFHEETTANIAGGVLSFPRGNERWLTPTKTKVEGFLSRLRDRLTDMRANLTYEKLLVRKVIHGNIYTHLESQETVGYMTFLGGTTGLVIAGVVGAVNPDLGRNTALPIIGGSSLVAYHFTSNAENKRLAAKVTELAQYKEANSITVSTLPKEDPQEMIF